MTLTPAEQAVVDDIAARADELVALTAELIAFDTTAREPEDPPREEAALQAHLGQRLGAAGASVDIWEPRHEDIADSRQMPRGSQIGFEGRPQLAARFAGAGGGRSLLFNGHIDAVSAEPKGQWTSDPFAAEVRDGLLYGRGACDMKGGVAAMTFAAEALVRGGVKLAGDLLVCTVTDEESSGIGGLAAVRHGVKADAGIVTEPTGFDVWVACRGTVYPTVSVPGRPGHAELHHPHWRDGGPVNAIEKGVVVLDAVSRMREDWEGRAAFRHDHLSPPTIIPTLMHAGEWSVTYPASCDITFGVLYIPAQSDPQGWGSLVEQEFERTVAAAAASDPWLAENPPTVTWSIDVPPMEIDPAHPIVGTTLEASAAVGQGGGAITGLDSWYDGASFTLFGDTPSIAFGPRTIHVGHTIDEHVPVDDLVACAQALAVAAMRYCGTA